MAELKSITLGDTTNTVEEVNPATDSVYGLVKLNPDGGVTLNEDGQIEVDGLWGYFPGGGVYYPPTLEPEYVMRNSVLVSEATGLKVTNVRTFALFGGANVTLKGTNAAGTTTYQASNSYNNRFLCASARGGYVAVDEASASEKVVKVVGVYLANDPDKTPLVPYSGDTESGNNIIIETDESINPDSAITKIRVYGSMTFDSAFQCGQSVGTGGATGQGKIVMLGQSQLALKGNSILVGNAIFTAENRSALFGANHINHVSSAFMAGEGHDSVNGSIGVGAIGRYSLIDANTVFAIGNGTANTARSNIFEVTDDNGATGVVIVSPGGNKFKLAVDDSGNLSTTPIT